MLKDKALIRILLTLSKSTAAVLIYWVGILNPAFARYEPIEYDSKTITEKDIEIIATCSGLFKALAQIYDREGTINISKTLNEFGNGYWYAAAYGYRIKKGYSKFAANQEADSREETSKSYYMAIYEADPEKFLTYEATKRMMDCKSKNDLQLYLKNLALEELRKHQSQ